jgi:2-amino-4-hydroxy-6-hydroxymethyldihydropteridine diphosphokinase
MIKTYLLLGSNSDDRAERLVYACREIERNAGRIIGLSGIYETDPWGFSSQHTFYNQVLILETLLTAEDLLNAILSVEDNAGRVRTNVGYSDRPLDIDILFYGEDVIRTDKLTIPHPRLHLRRFTLVPLAEVAPIFVHPVFNKTILQLLDECDDKGRVVKA